VHRLNLILEADDEKEILLILANEEFTSNNDFKNKFNLLKYDRKLQEKIFNAIQNLPDGDVKRLTGNDIPPIYRIRISKYRILFHMNEEGIQILKVDSRGDIYK
jgi:mRNA interferase RelE/StbE